MSGSNMDESRRIDEKTTDFTGGYGKIMSEKRVFYSAAGNFKIKKRKM